MTDMYWMVGRPVTCRPGLWVKSGSAEVRE